MTNTKHTSNIFAKIAIKKLKNTIKQAKGILEFSLSCNVLS